MFKLKHKHEDIFGDLFGSGLGALGLGGDSDAGSRGAGIEQQFNQQAIDELNRLLGPFISAGTGALPDVIQGTTAVGLDQRLAEIFNTNTFGSLVEERERGVRGQLSAGGLTRSGTAINEAARIPTDIGLALEQLLTNRSTNLAGTGLNAARGAGGGIAGLLSSSGQAGSSGLLIDAESKAAGLQNLLNLAGAAGGFALGGPQGAAAGATLAGQAGGAGFFSDIRLKENIEQIGRIGNLPLYQWDWCDFTKDTIINSCPTIGFLSREVKEIYPQFVFKFGSFEGIDYASLLNELNEFNKLKVAA